MTANAAPDGYDAAFPAMFRSAFVAADRVLRDPHTAEDVAIEACYRAARRWEHIATYASPWAVRVATNLAIDHARRTSRRPRLWPRAMPSVPDPTARLDLAAALRALPQRQREVVVLRYFGDFSEADTAFALGISAGTVKTHASRGLDALRSQLGVNFLKKEETR